MNAKLIVPRDMGAPSVRNVDHIVMFDKNMRIKSIMDVDGLLVLQDFKGRRALYHKPKDTPRIASDQRVSDKLFWSFTSAACTFVLTASMML